MSKPCEGSGFVPLRPLRSSRPSRSLKRAYLNEHLFRRLSSPSGSRIGSWTGCLTNFCNASQLSLRKQEGRSRNRKDVRPLTRRKGHSGNSSKSLQPSQTTWQRRLQSCCRRADSKKQSNFRVTSLRRPNVPLQSRNKERKHLASVYFIRAKIFDLLFRPVEALADYEKAYQFDPQNPLYAFAYARALQLQNQFSKAEPIYVGVLGVYRKLAYANPSEHLTDIAMTLQDPKPPNPGETLAKRDNVFRLAGFRPAFVFDAEQTHGKPLPEFAKTTGDTKDFADKLKAFVA